jgi:hypothetical protein
MIIKVTEKQTIFSNTQLLEISYDLQLSDLGGSLHNFQLFLGRFCDSARVGY